MPSRSMMREPILSVLGRRTNYTQPSGVSRPTRDEQLLQVWFSGVQFERGRRVYRTTRSPISPWRG